MQTLAIVFATASGVTLGAMLWLLWLAERFQFYTQPNERSTHRQPVPPVGGLAFAIGTLLATAVWCPAVMGALLPVLVPLVLLVLLGWVDDWRHLSPGQKLLGQLLAAGLLVSWAGLRIEHLEGIFGVGALSGLASWALSVLSVVGIVNAFNFIDGIDGLAGVLGLWVCAAFGIWLYGTGESDMALLAAALAGGLSTFLYFNVAPARVFMGDAGAMFLGAAAAVLALTAISANHHLPEGHAWHIASGPALAVAVLFVPLFDVVRVFVVRMARGRSPWRADRGHAHHVLLARGLTAGQTTLVLMSCCMGMTTLVYWLQEWGNVTLLLLQGMVALLASLRLTLP